MKIAIKIFLILSLVAASFYALIGVIYSVLGIVASTALSTDVNEAIITGIVILALGLLFIAIGVVVIVVCATTLKKLSKATCANDISTARKVVVLLLGNMIAGILLFCMKDKDFIDQKEVSNLDEIAKLKGLLDSGAITEEEFETKKKEYLDIKPAAVETVKFKLED